LIDSSAKIAGISRAERIVGGQAGAAGSLEASFGIGERGDSIRQKGTEA